MEIYGILTVWYGSSVGFRAFLQYFMLPVKAWTLWFALWPFWGILVVLRVCFMLASWYFYHFVWCLCFMAFS